MHYFSKFQRSPFLSCYSQYFSFFSFFLSCLHYSWFLSILFFQLWKLIPLPGTNWTNILALNHTLILYFTFCLDTKSPKLTNSWSLYNSWILNSDPDLTAQVASIWVSDCRLCFFLSFPSLSSSPISSLCLSSSFFFPLSPFHATISSRHYNFNSFTSES